MSDQIPSDVAPNSQAESSKKDSQAEGEHNGTEQSTPKKDDNAQDAKHVEEGSKGENNTDDMFKSVLPASFKTAVEGKLSEIANKVHQFDTKIKSAIADKIDHRKSSKKSVVESEKPPAEGSSSSKNKEHENSKTENDKTNYDQSVQAINAEIRKINQLPTVRLSNDEVNLERNGYHFQRHAIAYTNRSYIYLAKGLTTVPVVCKVTLLECCSPRMKKNFLKNSVRIIRYVGGSGQEPIHPTFIRVYEIFQVEMKIYTFMNEVPTENLLTMIKTRKSFTQDEGRNWMRNICDAVQFIQKRGIAHRSIKIDHILFDQFKTPKICGWGRSVIYWDPKKGKILNQNKEIKSFDNRHMPPEAFTGPYDPARADNWALGVLLGAIHTRRYVFNIKSRVDFATQWKTFSKHHRINPIVMDILNKIFVSDLSKRVSVTQMLRHQYFSATAEEIDTPKPRGKSSMSINKKNASRITPSSSTHVTSLINDDGSKTENSVTEEDIDQDIDGASKRTNSAADTGEPKALTAGEIPIEEAPGSEIPQEGEGKAPIE